MEEKDIFYTWRRGWNNHPFNSRIPADAIYCNEWLWLFWFLMCTQDGLYTHWYILFEIDTSLTLFCFLLSLSVNKDGRATCPHFLDVCKCKWFPSGLTKPKRRTRWCWKVFFYSWCKDVFLHVLLQKPGVDLFTLLYKRFTLYSPLHVCRLDVICTV